MTFTAVLENIARSPIATKIGEKLKTAKSISLSGLSRLGKGLISTHLCQQQTKPLLIVTATLEEATRWALQLQSMSWHVYLYPPLDAFPYEPSQIDLETAWTRIEILAELLAKSQPNLAIAYTLNHKMTMRSPSTIRQNVKKLLKTSYVHFYILLVNVWKLSHLFVSATKQQKKNDILEYGYPHRLP
ncbi:MAG: hypothetical protein ACK45T_09755, partial [Pseudanabaena sp.]